MSVFVSIKPSTRMVRQELAMSCGPACCRQLLLERGILASEASLRADTRCKVDLGSTAADLALGLNAAVGAEEYRAGMVDPLRDLPKLMRRAPFLAMLNLGYSHWVLVDGQSGLLVQLRDPAGTPRDPSVGAEATMRIEQFHDRWKRCLHHVVFRA